LPPSVYKRSTQRQRGGRSEQLTEFVGGNLSSFEDRSDCRNSQVARVNRKSHGAPVRMAKANMAAFGASDIKAGTFQGSQKLTGRDPWDPA